MSFARKIAGIWIEIEAPFTLGEGDEAMSYPANWPDLATPEERAAADIAEIVEPAAPGPTLRVTGETIEDVDGVPHRQWTTEAAPAPSAPSQAQLRLALAALGLTTQQVDDLFLAAASL